MKTQKREVGDLGEEIALNFLQEKEYFLVEKNYLKKFGEIDLVMKKENKIFFVEVKTSKNSSNFLPEDNLTKEKINKFEKIGEYYIREKKLEKVEYFFCAVFVYLDECAKKAKVKFIKEIY